MRELSTPGEVAGATEDPLVRWAAQALTSGYPHERGRAWQLGAGTGAAVAVLAPGLNRSDRLVFTGSAETASELLRKLLPGIGGPALRPLAGSTLARQVSTRLGGLAERARFGWMDLRDGPPHTSRPHEVRWLTGTELPAVGRLFAAANPGSYVVPGDPGARRWAGITDVTGAPVSVAAEAWSAPGLGFIAGVATHPDHRNRGLSRAVCEFLTAELHREHGAVALMVDADSPPAIRVYERLGFTYRSVTAMRFSAPSVSG